MHVVLRLVTRTVILRACEVTNCNSNDCTMKASMALRPMHMPCTSAVLQTPSIRQACRFKDGIRQGYSRGLGQAQEMFATDTCSVYAHPRLRQTARAQW